MIFVESFIAGVVVVKPEAITDARGSFARSYCREEFIAHGLDPTIAQCSVSRNALKGTLRGMHFQHAPHQEAKLIRVTRGAIHDVALDLREGSPTFLKSFAIELNVENGFALYVPAGCAHGFQTLCNDTDVLYQISVPYQPDFARGARWNDAAFDIAWPVANPILSPRDMAFADWTIEQELP